MKLKYITYLLLIIFTFVGCSRNQTSNMAIEELNSSLDLNEKKENLTDDTEKISTSNVNIATINKEKLDSKLDKILEILPNIIKDYKDNISIYYYNFDSKEEYYLNEDVYYLTASLKKIPQVMQVLDKVYNGDVSLDTKLEYQYADYADGTGILQFEEKIGSRTISELIELSMTESDNIAYNMLNRLCENSLLEYTNDMLDEDAMIIDNGYTKLTAKHNFKILYKLYTNPDNNPYYNIVIEHLKKTAFNDSLNKYLPENKVSHKIGSYFRSYHDSGIIFGKQTYILVVLTRDIGELTNDPEFSDEQEERYVLDWGKEAFELIATISKNIYDIIEQP